MFGQPYPQAQPCAPSREEALERTQKFRADLTAAKHHLESLAALPLFELEEIQHFSDTFMTAYGKVCYTLCRAEIEIAELAKEPGED